MKKALSVLLAVLVVFSMCSVFAFADDESAGNITTTPPITVMFMSDGKVLMETKVQSGAILTPSTPDNPTKQKTETTEYIFAGWQQQDAEGNVIDETLYQKSTIPAAYLAEGETSKTVIYVAIYTEKDITGNQTFWQFFASIFERLNMIFEYFAKIFGF